MSIHAPREGSYPGDADFAPIHPISIHAPREGSDTPPSETGPDGTGISIHAPREGSDTGRQRRKGPAVQFLSTLPARGATRTLQRTSASWTFLSTLPARGATGSAVGQSLFGAHFYPRSPRGERREMAMDYRVRNPISIHAPREGSALDVVRAGGPDDGFLSTLPARGATH